MQTGLIAKVLLTLLFKRLLKHLYYLNIDFVVQMTGILEASISKLARYDEGSLLAPILSLTVRLKHLFIENNWSYKLKYILYIIYY